MGEKLHYKITLSNGGKRELTEIEVSANPASRYGATGHARGGRHHAMHRKLCRPTIGYRGGLGHQQGVGRQPSDGEREKSKRHLCQAVWRPQRRGQLVVTVHKSGRHPDCGFVLSNSGNMTLANVSLGATLFGPGSISSCSRASWRRGPSSPVPSPYMVTQADVAAGQVVIEVKARGTAARERSSASGALTITRSPGPSDEEVRNSFESLTGLFMAQRADRILQNEPRSYGLRGRAGGEGRAGLVAKLEGSGSAIDGSFSASLQGMRVRALQLAGDGLPDPPDRNWIDRFDIWVEGKFRLLFRSR